MDMKDVKRRDVLPYDDFLKARDVAMKTIMTKPDQNANPAAHSIKAENLYVRHDSNIYKASGIPFDENMSNLNNNANPNHVDVQKTNHDGEDPTGLDSTSKVVTIEASNPYAVKSLFDKPYNKMKQTAQSADIFDNKTDKEKKKSANDAAEAFGNIYEYSILKSPYFSQYEKIWIEGFCNDNKIKLSESNICDVLSLILNKCPESIKIKTINLIKESEKFSNYAKTLFLKTWDNVLGFSMTAVKPTGTINESQIDSMKKTNKFWLLEAPMIVANEVAISYLKSVLVETLSNNCNLFEDIKTFNPGEKNNNISVINVIAKAKSYFSYDSIKLPYPNSTINENILIKEPVLNMIPDSKKIISMIAWSAESTLLLKSLPK